MTCSKSFGATLTRYVVTMVRKQVKSDTLQSSSKKRPTLDPKGQERLYFVTKKGEPAQWHGLAELREGVL